MHTKQSKLVEWTVCVPESKYLLRNNAHSRVGALRMGCQAHSINLMQCNKSEGRQLEACLTSISSGSV
jgi:hypothetical protein